MTTLFLQFGKIEGNDEAKCRIFYWSKTPINESDVDDVFESIDSTIISKTCKIFQKKFWLDQIFNISKYKPLSGSSYIKLPKETDHPKKFD